MNSRLKQLMLEAGYAAPEIAGRAKKLTELIVKDCANMTDMYVAMKVEPKLLGGLMLETFGVKDEQV